MGLDIYFLARDNHQNGAVVETQEHQEVGAFRKVKPLLTWFREHTGASDEQHAFPVTRRSLAALLRDLSMLTPGTATGCFLMSQARVYGGKTMPVITGMTWMT